MRPVFALLLMFCVSGCAARPETWVELKGQRYLVEVVADEPGRQQGLMYREQMPVDQGMLFLFDRMQPLAFWMKNTRISLDIIYFDQERRVVSVANKVPPCKSALCPNYPSSGPAIFVLELNAGEADRLGVKRGDDISFGPGIPSAGSP